MKKSEMHSTDARIEDGLPRSSVDASVMDAERRRQVASVEPWVNFSGRMNP